MNAIVLSFPDLRSDWYYSNQIVPRYLTRARKGEAICFEGFPRQWLPLFAWCSATWRGSTDPSSYLPLISPLDEATLSGLIDDARRQGALRTLVEAIACTDPVLADALYIVDHKSSVSEATTVSLPLTSWASYGRPEVRAFEERALSIGGHRESAIVLPCSRRRPYHLSTTHKRIWRRLAADGVCTIADARFDQVVLSSIGVVPLALWDDPVVRAYDAGVPDIYRLLRLMRAFFRKHRYRDVVDCLSFEPYSDLLRITHREGLFDNLVLAPKQRVRRFFVR